MRHGLLARLTVGSHVQQTTMMTITMTMKKWTLLEYADFNEMVSHSQVMFVGQINITNAKKWSRKVRITIVKIWSMIINKLKNQDVNFHFFLWNWKIKIISFQTLFRKNCPLTGSTVRFVWIRLSCHWTEKYLQNSFRNFRIFRDYSRNLVIALSFCL